ncbi:adenylate/guanylate cyclase domain-containing protein [bacterium]|nr:adenylate/guanylate cyclase domain-containing protein [bacterium]
MNKLITIILAMGLLIWNPYPFQLLELKVFDYQIMNTEPVQNENILIVDIDESIIEAYRGYPLPRDFYASLIKRTSAIPGITVLMPDPDVRGPRGDIIFGKALEVIPTVLASTASIQATGVGPHVGTAQLGENPIPWLYEYPGIIRTESTLASKIKGIGLVTATPEIDGVTRRIPLVVNVQSKPYPSFALELLRVGLGDPSYQLKTTPEGIEWIRVPTYPLINTDPNGRIFLNWNTTFYKQTAAEYMENPIQAPFVIFGTTAEGITNPVGTPAGAKYPHEIQANILHNLITGTAPSSPSWSLSAKLAFGLLSFTLLALTVSRIYLSVLALGLVIVGAVYGMGYAYKSSYLIDLSGIVVISILYWAYHTFLSFLSEYRQKLQIKQQFGTYVSPDLVKKLQEDPTLLRLGGSTEQLTFLFSDIRGFTPISEKYQKNPQGLTSLINRFLDNQTEIILKHGGTIDKYMGDCIMAFWGAPLPDENHIENATKAAIEMRIALEKLNETLREEGLDQINTGAGINTGNCVVGNFGSSTRFDYSVLGDAVNLAARLESSCKNYDADLIISEHSLVEDYEYEFLDEVTVKGKSEPVKIYTIRK